MPEPHVTILMGLFNGERFLSEQLDSILAQTHENWSLLASDDGSTDNTRAIFSAFAKVHPTRDIRLIEGPKRGFAQNFVQLLQHVSDPESFVAFADQDDVWMPNKLARAIAQMAPFPRNHPVMVCGRTWYADENLTPTTISTDFPHPPQFRNSLVQSIAGGNTITLNGAAVRILTDNLAATHRVAAHDWWFYQVVTAVGGTVVYDREPTLFYRQHDTNIFGQNVTLRKKLSRLWGLFNGTFPVWIHQQAEGLSQLKTPLTPHAETELRTFRAAINAPWIIRPLRVLQSGAFRQSRAETLLIALAMLTARARK